MLLLEFAGSVVATEKQTQRRTPVLMLPIKYLLQEQINSVQLIRVKTNSSTISNAYLCCLLSSALPGSTSLSVSLTLSLLVSLSHTLSLSLLVSLSLTRSVSLSLSLC